STRTTAPPCSSLIAPTFPATIASHFATTVSPSSEYQAKAGAPGSAAAAGGFAEVSGAGAAASSRGGCAQDGAHVGTAAIQSAESPPPRAGRLVGPAPRREPPGAGGGGGGGGCPGAAAGGWRPLLGRRGGPRLAEPLAQQREVVRPRRDREREDAERGLVDR